MRYSPKFSPFPSLLLHHEVAVDVVHAVAGRVGLDQIHVVAPEPLDDVILVPAVGPQRGLDATFVSLF